MSRTSNNKICQLIIHCVFCNSGRMNLAYDDVRYMAYRWGIPCLDYCFDVLISWSHKLSLYDWFCCIHFHRVLLQIFGFVIIIIILYVFSCLTTGVLFLWSPVLIILYHACSLLDIIYHLSTCFCMHVLTVRFSIYVPWLRFIDTRVLIPARHFSFITPLVGEFLIPLDPHVQIPELGAFRFFQLLIRDEQL